MRTSNIEHRTSNIEQKAKQVHTWMLYVGYRMLDVRRFLFILAAAFAGCCPHVPPSTAYYSGPTESMDVVIAAINRNNVKIPTLWTQLNYSATIVDEKKETQSLSGDGALMYAGPRSLLINGNADFVGQVFQIGSNDDEFWLKIRSQKDAFNYWWGHYANLGKPGTQPIPIRPDLVLQVLGIGLYGTDFLQQPVPVMRFDNEHDAYVFDMNVRTGDRWQTLEEIWYDRLTKRPTRVLLYGEGGRVQLAAELSDHTPVNAGDLPKEQRPAIARHYVLFAPDNGTHITFDLLNEPELQHAAPRGSIPRSGSFERIEPDADTKVIEIDKGAGGGVSLKMQMVPHA